MKKLYIASMQGGEGWIGLYRASSREEVFKYITKTMCYSRRHVRKCFDIREIWPEEV